MKKKWFVILAIILLLGSIFSIKADLELKSKYTIASKEDKTKFVELHIIVEDGTTKEEMEEIADKLLKEKTFIRFYDDSYRIAKGMGYEPPNIALGFASDLIGVHTGEDYPKEISVNQKDWNKKPTDEEFDSIYRIRRLLFQDFADIDDERVVLSKISEILNIPVEEIKQLNNKYSEWIS